jgi:hypothetical protein
MTKTFRFLLCTLLLLTWPLASLFAQSSSSPQQSPPPQPPPAQTQTPAQPKEESVADAAKKSQKDKPKPKKVYTEDDFSGTHKGGVSVVGEENKKSPRRVGNANPDGDNEPNGEEYWRSRSQPILDEIAATDQAIEQLKEDIKKYGSGGFDVTTGMKDNIAYIHDRNGQIQDLQKKKANLQKQLGDLEEEGRKAGAQPAWFR